MRLKFKSFILVYKPFSEVGVQTIIHNLSRCSILKEKWLTRNCSITIMSHLNTGILLGRFNLICSVRGLFVFFGLDFTNSSTPPEVLIHSSWQDSGVNTLLQHCSLLLQTTLWAQSMNGKIWTTAVTLWDKKPECSRC